MRWRLKRIRVRRKRRTSVTVHYLQHKELARALVHKKLREWNRVYGFSYKRVAIRNTTRSWGSCTSLKNLNFSYKILFLPPHLQDYIIVHELCHLQELNHGPNFWHLVGEQVPNYVACKAELATLEKKPLTLELPSTVEAYTYPQ
jgi:predicted metal-dependent hydrolase